MPVHTIKNLQWQPHAPKTVHSLQNGLQGYIGHLLFYGPFTLLIFLRAAILLPLSVCVLQIKLVSSLGPEVDMKPTPGQSELDQCD